MCEDSVNCAQKCNSLIFISINLLSYMWGYESHCPFLWHVFSLLNKCHELADVFCYGCSPCFDQFCWCIVYTRLFALSVLQYMLSTVLMPFILFKSLSRMFIPSTQNVFGPTHYLLMLSHIRLILGALPFTADHNSLEHILLQWWILPYKTALYILFSLKFPSISPSLYSVLPSLYVQPVPVPFVLLYKGGQDIFTKHHSFQVLLWHTPHHTTLSFSSLLHIGPFYLLL